MAAEERRRVREEAATRRLRSASTEELALEAADEEAADEEATSSR